MRKGTNLNATADDPIELLRRLVHIESPSGDTAASARMAELVAAELTACGAEITTELTPAGTNLRADLPGTSPDAGDPVLLVGHLDTVWPVGTLDGEVPWVLDGDTVRGPGVYDMKSGIVVMVHALRALLETPHRAVRVALACDEELGSTHSRDFVLGCAKGAAAAIGFESPHPDGSLKIGRRGSCRVRIEVAGRASHAALDPEAGVSAIDELVDQLLRVREITGDPGLPAEVLCNVGTITGGGRANVVPDAAAAEIGLRFADAESETRVLAALEALRPIRVGASLRIRRLSQRPTWQAQPADLALARELGLDGSPAAGGGDTNFLGATGIPTVDGFGPRGGGAHALSEHASRASLDERIEHLRKFLQIP